VRAVKKVGPRLKEATHHSLISLRVLTRALREEVGKKKERSTPNEKRIDGKRTLAVFWAMNVGLQNAVLKPYLK